ncbi:hypothetical protein GOEFS_120_00330 [Gordonia effusa NBRC 100432]|uniref:Lipoprotein n=1 Tax=Gordonia effusa NBRC 100432 TaxID=1077974 RepID=H0R672_9ACTN|nr:hypothetical protein [Gordonia effusa]GAB20573.1 hypothetical protein GOEFS_120_00330 [Gordonia effusa NBRC 100432]
MRTVLKWSVVTCIATVFTLVSSGCQDSEQSAAALPTCPGSATSEYGLGNAINAAAPKLAALPDRVATGEGTVISVEGAAAPLRVAITVCGTGLDDAELKDVASTLGIAVAGTTSLGKQVGALTVELQPANKVIRAAPFVANNFTSTAELTDLRGNWAINSN